ncbi:MAG: aminoacyl-tRNA hydrolase [Candidatus Pacebacteria bacterium]|jgi:PTH1 family peptidyl-tRNA hydrolase|nr:aminoacyl-tRNA hydrolase [Candidatus Paceibacterota bacterium]|tara:strand:+ start:17622 stop:18179 length:558 start_codon:yes stop_codon:yes gene_type:complete
MIYIVGLGNPGEEYEKTRHNTGALAVENFAKKNKFAFFKTEKIGKEKIQLLLPQTFMNKSGTPLKKLITSKKKAGNLIVIYDDLDMPLGKFKISFGRGSGGHKGMESVIRAVGTKDFIRIRVGITPATPLGKIKKPAGEKKIVDFILGNFSKKELDTLERIFRKISDAIETIVVLGKAKAMNEFN